MRTEACIVGGEIALDHQCRLAFANGRLERASAGKLDQAIYFVDDQRGAGRDEQFFDYGASLGRVVSFSIRRS